MSALQQHTHVCALVCVCVCGVTAPTFPSALSPLRMWDADLWRPSGELEMIFSLACWPWWWTGGMKDVVQETLQTLQRPVRGLLKSHLGLLRISPRKYLGEGGVRIRSHKHKQTSGQKGVECSWWSLKLNMFFDIPLGSTCPMMITRSVVTQAWSTSTTSWLPPSTTTPIPGPGPSAVASTSQSS